MLIACIAILVEDRTGSPIFSQTRVGKGGSTFKMFKLRTMHKDAHLLLKDMVHMNESDGPVFKIKDDPRITKVGRFLRRSNLDEVPQFWNVLRGNMSLVGPRPPLPEEVEKYNDWQKLRLTIKPGITCYWQISQNRNDIKFDDWVRLDLKYIEEQNLWVDFKILVMTAGCLFKMNGR